MAHPTPPPLSSHGVTEPNTTQITWSCIPISLAYWEKLQLLCHSEKELKREGYVIKPLDAAQIRSKARCMRCGKRTKGRANLYSKPVSVSAADAVNEHERPQHLTGDVNTEDAIDEESLSLSHGVPNKKQASGKCSYHTSFVQNKVFTCCGQHMSTAGCTVAPEHTMPRPDDPVLQEYWQYHPTPPIIPPSSGTPDPGRNSVPSTRGSRKRGSSWDGRQQQRQPPSTGRQNNNHRQHHEVYHNPHRFHAIALDCEMGVAANGDMELIRLTVVDFFSGAVLLDSLVAPSVAMAHYNTRFSGVTARDMREAMKARTAIFGRDRARELLFRLVGPDTVVVVHGGSGDFSALRWIHPRIVDTYILDAYTGVKVNGGRSLQNLCKVRLGIAVQVSGPQTRGGVVAAGAGRVQSQAHQTHTHPKGKGTGHDSYEDAMAARELLAYWASHIPDD
ncbi:hypothetical protein AYL99_05256 [Fonsecaea erecta]|uniref:Exonuclease domain-containing protein n=1 Tax=Fonsecaea erecta TaxID=1367422 RepID=A0A178ZKD4_9EURO|nr:hypothetical protein AYL99_05256 [Fonsecaea erecta]OAP60254.1 hypothetical protein AYL99_05256 [Fonsecaea erecta]